ncbi:formin-binding protein [Dimargaris xerosporica]|nr:formin-binding protein [Dimargaris xerosporica]
MDHHWLSNLLQGKDDRGVTVLMNRLRNAKQTCQDLQNMFNARATIEEEFGKKLLKLARTPLGKHEIGTLKDSLDIVRSELEISAKAHIDLAHQIKVELENTMVDFVNKQRERRKKQTSVIEKSSRNRSMVRSQLVKAKDRYRSEVSKASGLEQTILGMQHVRDTERLRGRLDKTQQATRQADEDYQKTVHRLKDAQRRWEGDWRDACDVFQELEEDRLDFLRSHLWSYTNVLSNVLVTEDESFERVRKSLEAFSVEDDIQLFINDHGTGQPLPVADPPALRPAPSIQANSDIHAHQHSRMRSQSVSTQGQMANGSLGASHGASNTFRDDRSRRQSAPGNPAPVPSYQASTNRNPMPSPAQSRGPAKSRPISVFYDASTFANDGAPTQPPPASQPPAPVAQASRPSSQSPQPESGYGSDHGQRSALVSHGAPTHVPHSFAGMDSGQVSQINPERNAYTSMSHYQKPPPPTAIATNNAPNPFDDPIARALNALSPVIGPLSSARGMSGSPTPPFAPHQPSTQQTQSSATMRSQPSQGAEGYTNGPSAPNNHPQSRRNRSYTNPPAPGHQPRQQQQPALNVNVQKGSQPFGSGGSNQLPTPQSLYPSSETTPTTPNGHPRYPGDNGSPTIGYTMNEASHGSANGHGQSIPVSQPRSQGPPSSYGRPTRAPQAAGHGATHSSSAPNSVPPQLQYSGAHSGYGGPQHSHSRSLTPVTTDPPMNGGPGRPFAHHSPTGSPGHGSPRNYSPVPPYPTNSAHGSQHPSGIAHKTTQLPNRQSSLRPAQPSYTNAPPLGPADHAPRPATAMSAKPSSPMNQSPGRIASGSPQIRPGSAASAYPGAHGGQHSPSQHPVGGHSQATQHNGHRQPYYPTPQAGRKNSYPQPGPTANHTQPPPPAAPAAANAGPPKSQASNRPVLFYVRALYDYEAEAPEEITISEGCVIAVLATHIDGWWEGQVADHPTKSGMFPSNFTEPVQC